MARRSLAVVVLLGVAIALLAPVGQAQDTAMTLPAGFTGGGAQHLAGTGWTYDAAVWATAHAAAGEPERARTLLDELVAKQRPDGALAFSFDLRTGAGGGPLRSGAIAWVGLAAAQYRTTTCSERYDAAMADLARWLLGQRNGALVRGGPDVAWVSTEHNLEARAFFAALADLAGGRTACPAGIDGRGGAELVAELDAAVVALDAAIESELFAGDHFRQGLGDSVRPFDVQAFGALWLLEQGRDAAAARVVAYADAHLAHGWGYRPYAEDWTPDVRWTEGTLQMRLAKAALGQDTAAIDAGVAALAGEPGYLPHADRDVAGSIGEYHSWLATAPAAWERLSGTGFALLGR
jgi:hypothetical protein